MLRLSFILSSSATEGAPVLVALKGVLVCHPPGDTATRYHRGRIYHRGRMESSLLFFWLSPVWAYDVVRD